MNKKIIIFTLVLVSVASISYAVLPLFVTFAQVKPENIEYSVGAKQSIDRALIKTRSDAMESMRGFFGNHIYL
jgi:cytochrome c oxidase assembly protein Cox11